MEEMKWYHNLFVRTEKRFTENISKILFEIQ